MNEQYDTDRLATLVNKKLFVLEQLRDLSRRQAIVVAEGAMDQLMSLLAAKQKLARALHEIEHETAPFRAQAPESRRWRSEEDRRRCREAAERCESLLRELLLHEKQCEADLVRRRDEAAHRLRVVHSADQARQAYTQSTVARRKLDLTAK